MQSSYSFFSFGPQLTKTLNYKKLKLYIDIVHITTLQSNFMKENPPCIHKHSAFNNTTM